MADVAGPASSRIAVAEQKEPRLTSLRARYPTQYAPIAFPEQALQASEADREDARARVTQLMSYVAGQVEAGELPSLDLPDVHRANSLHDAQGNVFLGRNVRPLALDREGGKAFMRLLLTLEAAADNLRNNVCTTKRGLYYRHQAKLPDAHADQVRSDRALASLANLLGVRRKTLGFVEARRGLLYGRLVLRDGDVAVDLSKMGRGGYPIPRFTDDSEIVGSDAAFILVVEKMSVAFQLVQAEWWQTVPCILVCGEGFPSLSAREYVRTLVDTLGIPAIVCVDGDPWGIQVALTYAHGSMATALETPWLACNNIWWAGIYPSDVDRYLGNDALIRLTDEDREAARQLMEHPSEAYVGKRVREEVAMLIDRGAKVELDSIARDLPKFVDAYLPAKIFDSDLVKL